MSAPLIFFAICENPLGVKKIPGKKIRVNVFKA